MFRASWKWERRRYVILTVDFYVRKTLTFSVFPKLNCKSVARPLIQNSCCIRLVGHRNEPQIDRRNEQSTRGGSVCHIGRWWGPLVCPNLSMYCGPNSTSLAPSNAIHTWIPDRNQPLPCSPRQRQVNAVDTRTSANIIRRDGRIVRPIYSGHRWCCFSYPLSTTSNQLTQNTK